VTHVRLVCVECNAHGLEEAAFASPPAGQSEGEPEKAAILRLALTPLYNPGCNL
jgi:hypothetical protein